MTQGDQNFAKLLGIVEDLRKLNRKVLGEDEISTISLSRPSLPMDELYFRKAVSWCYALLLESGYFFKYSKKLLRGADPRSYQKFNSVMELVILSRTVQQHNLFADRPSDAKKIRTVETWMLDYAGHPPNWENGSIALLAQVCESLISVYTTWETRCEIGEDKDSIRREYVAEKNTAWEPHQFDPIIQTAAVSVGLEEFDCVAFRNSQGRLERWRNLMACFQSRAAAQEAIERAIQTELVSLFGDA